MPPVIGAIIAVGVAVAVKVGVISAFVGALITIAATLAITLLTQKPRTNRVNQGAELRTKIDPGLARQVLAGFVATGGSCHFAFTNTDDSKKPNRYLYRVIQLSDQPINSLVAVYEAANLVSFSGDVTAGWQAATGYRTKAGAACLWMRVYLGSFSATADATLISETGTWTSAHKGTGLAYAIIKMDSDSDAFPNGEPEFVFHVQGAKLYDDRKDSTKPGGSGAHRLNDYSTWEYSDTASLITAQFLRGFKINGVRILGVGAEERDLLPSSLFSAHNTCEQTITVAAGTEKRYVAGIAMNADEAASEILTDLQAAMDGRIFDRGGTITILPGANRTPVLNLTDADIIWTAEKSWQPQASLNAMLNCVTGNFIDSENLFTQSDLPVLKNSTWETDDGGERFTSFFSFRAVNKSTQGQRITKRLHQASRHSGTCGFVGGVWLMEMEQGDWFTLTTSRWGFSSKYFEIQDITLTKDMRVTIIGREVNPSNDTWNHSTDEVARTDATWTPAAYTLPVPVISLTTYVATETNTGYQTYRVDINLVDPQRYGGFVKNIELEMLPSGASTPIALAPFTVNQQKVSIYGLAPGLNYQIRARTSDGSRASDWSSYVSTSMASPGRIVAGQLDYLVGMTRTPIQNLMPAEANATFGAPTGSPVGTITAGDVSTTINSGGGIAPNMVGTSAIVANGVNRILAAQNVSSPPTAMNDNTYTTICSVTLPSIVNNQFLCSGYVKFGRGSANVAESKRADVWIKYRVNGGAWQGVGAYEAMLKYTDDTDTIVIFQLGSLSLQRSITAGSFGDTVEFALEGWLVGGSSNTGGHNSGSLFVMEVRR